MLITDNTITDILNLSVKIEKNSSNKFFKLVRNLPCYNCGDFFLGKIQSCLKVEFIGNHRSVTIVETASKINDEHIKSDSETIDLLGMVWWLQF